MARTRRLSQFNSISQVGNTNLQNVKFPLLDLRETDPSLRNKNIEFNSLKDDILNRNTIPNILYVNKKGNDNNDGKTFNSAKASIKAALATITNSVFFNKTQDSANLILKNKNYIVDEAAIRLKNQYPDSYPSLSSTNLLKCRRDMGYLVESVVKDLRLGGNLNVIQAASVYYDTTNGNSNATLILTEQQKLETIYAFTQVRELIKFALDGWRNYVGGSSLVAKYTPQFLNPNAPDYIIEGDCSDVKNAIQTYFDIIFSILNVGLDSVSASSGPINTTIYVAPGTYVEDNPLFVPPNVAIVGDNLRTANVVPLHPTEDLFHVNNGTYIYGFTFSGHTDGAAVVAFPESGAGVIVRSPYVQNCTSLTATGTGMRVDGNRADGLKSMVLDSYTQYNQGGTGIEIINGGYAQLVSIFEICCEKGVYVNNGATCSITNSNTDFGTYGLYAEGTTSQQYTQNIDGSPAIQKIVRNTEEDVNGRTFTISGIPQGERPYVGQGMLIKEQYYFIKEARFKNKGSGYTISPNVNIQSPSGPEGIDAEILVNIDPLTGSADGEPIIVVSGTQFRIQDFAAPGSYTISGGREIWDGTINPGFISVDPPVGGNPIEIEIVMEPVFYTVSESKKVSEGVYKVTILERLPFLPDNEDVVKFFQLSRIIASSHCFEYVGAGNNLSDAIPAKGGVPVQGNEVFFRDGGRVVFTSTDHIGNFRIGSDLVINQDTGTLTGRTFDKSLFTTLTPFILAIQ